ncbi:MAG: CoA transferase [Deltaproteobacteria bacterium]|nr:CoA transferase [Deltaproteobacteria bacterium]
MLPFEKIRIADFTTMLAGAGICTALSDMGADVIKVESLDGDPWRVMGGSFMPTNRGKRAIAIDLTKDEGRQIAYQLIATADLFVENSRPGIMERLGLDHEAVKKVKPDIIYVSSPAYGSKGPEIKRPGYDPLLQSLSGQMEGQGGVGQVPVFHKIALNDEAAPAVGAFGAALAIFQKLRTGRGQFVETSLLNCAVALQSERFIDHKGRKHRNEGGWDIKGKSATNRMYQAMDGEWFYVLCTKEEHWQALCGAIGRSELTTDPRFATAGARKKHDKALAAILQDSFFTTLAAAWVPVLQAAGVPCVSCTSMEGIFKDPHCMETEFFVFQDHPLFGRVQLPGVIPLLSETPGAVPRHAPLLGEHTDEVLREIGYTDAQIKDFRERRLVA